MATVADAALETRENIPLKEGAKTASWCSCNEEYLSGSKFINVSFGTLTIIITIALILQIYYGDYQVVPHGSVATDSLECSKIGTAILKKGGNSIDATIASAFCMAVVTPHLISLDGEGQLLIYNHRKRLVPDVVDFTNAYNDEDSKNSLPRLVIGLAYIHQQYASLTWKELVTPAADLARRGFLIPKMLVQAIKQAKVEDLYGHQEAGQLLQLEALANTLQKIANFPEKELYGYFQNSNAPIFSQALKSTFNHFDIYVPGSPSAGPILLSNLQQLEKFNFTASDTIKSEYIYRIAKATQNLYDDFKINDTYHEGASTNVAIMDLDETYVSLTMGLYGLFGSGEMTTGGYVLDVRGRNRTCTRVPMIIADGAAICGRRWVLGANDPATATQLVMGLLVAGDNATSGVEAPRFHILHNGSIGIEGSHTPLFNEEVLKNLETLTTAPLLVPEPYMSSNLVEKVRDDLNSHSDSRGGGIASRF